MPEIITEAENAGQPSLMATVFENRTQSGLQELAELEVYPAFFHINLSLFFFFTRIQQLIQGRLNSHNWKGCGKLFSHSNA